MPFADLTGVLIYKLRLEIPFSGRWHADMVLVDMTDVSGPQTLTLAGTTWQCAYVRAINFTGQRGVRVVAGAGGWSTVIPAKQYQGPPAITTQLVCSDAAAACGELAPVIDASVSATVGTAWLRQAGPAVRAIQQALGDSWWTDPKGQVQTAPRGGSVSSAFDAIEVDGAPGRYLIATESPGDWMPGVSFDGPTVSGMLSRVAHVIEGDTFRTEVLVV